MSYAAVSEIVATMKFHMPTEAEIQAKQAEALAYIRAKWPEANWEDVRPDAWDILRTRGKERACAACMKEGRPHCERLRSEALCQEEFRGLPIYTIRSTPCPLVTAQEASKSDFDRLFELSGLVGKQRYMTFDSYATNGLGAEIVDAKSHAIEAAQKGSWLVLAGHRGVGKTHLAVSIMNEVMEHGQQAYFRLVPEMLDELRDSFDIDDYRNQMRALKEVPCLVLDDLGKERDTKSGYDFLYQIIDSRYRNRRQTIITTNAMSKNELLSWGKPAYMGPLISRLTEIAAWITILEAGDYRSKLREAQFSLPISPSR